MPPGLAANTAAVLAATLGRQLPALIGPDLSDAAAQNHLGLVAVPPPILTAGREQIRSLRTQAALAGDSLVVDVTEVAQRARTYSEYARMLAETPAEALIYVGVALCGFRKQITKLTGSLPLLR